MTYRLYIRLADGQIKYKDMNWEQLIGKVRQVMVHPKIIKFWIRHVDDQQNLGKYIIINGPNDKPRITTKWIN